MLREKVGLSSVISRIRRYFCMQRGQVLALVHLDHKTNLLAPRVHHHGLRRGRSLNLYLKETRYRAHGPRTEQPWLHYKPLSTCNFSQTRLFSLLLILLCSGHV